MTDTQDSTGAIPGRAAEIIAAGRPQAVGSFSFWFDEQRWEWSDEVARMHGYQPDAVEPTTELLLAHKHPDDRAQVAETIARSLDTGEPFSSRHRFLDTTGVVHHVIVVADRILDDTGTLVGTAGYYIDVTDTLAEQRRETLTDTLPEVVEARAVIEQVKGILMYVYRIDSDRAFDVLRWRSQETNMKLRDLAGHLLAELHTLPSGTAASRSQFDHLLLTAHLHHDGQATTGHM